MSFLEQALILRRILHSVGNRAKHLGYRGVRYVTMCARLVSHKLLSPGKLWHAFTPLSVDRWTQCL